MLYSFIPFRYKKADKHDWTRVGVSTNENVFAIKKLTMNTFYKFRIGATFPKTTSIWYTSVKNASTLPGCGDGFCSLSESCLTCPFDCWCNVPGWKVETFDLSTSASVPASVSISTGIFCLITLKRIKYQ